MLKSKAFAGLLCLFVAAYAAAMPKWRKLPDQSIETPVGKFALTNLRTIHVFGQLTIEGELVNNTNKSWDSVWVAIDLSDKNGHVMPKEGPSEAVLAADPNASAQLHASNIAPGDKFKINFVKDNVKADGNSLNIVFKYAYGAYPLTYKMTLVKPAASDNLDFHDDTIAVAFVPGKTALNFALQNKGDAPVTIDWNMVSFVQPNGSAQGVIHNGVKLIDRTAPKAPSMVPPGARLEDAIIPVDNVKLVDRGWTTDQLLPAGPAGLNLAGQQFSVFLPLDIGGTKKNYNFVFKILSVQ